jgi:SnoaL-like domain
VTQRNDPRTIIQGEEPASAQRSGDRGPSDLTAHLGDDHMLKSWRNFALASLSAAVLFALWSLGSAIAASRSTYAGTPQDFMEISQLFSRYNLTIDAHDGEAWADNFAPNGVFQDPSWCAVGRDRLIGVIGREPKPGADEKQHHVHSLGPIEYVDRNHATVRSTVMVVRETGAGISGGISITGVYDDQLVRIGNRWLFAYRLVHRPSATPPIPCAGAPP